MAVTGLKTLKVSEKDFDRVIKVVEGNFSLKWHKMATKSVSAVVCLHGP